VTIEDAVKAEKRAYHKAWRDANKDKVRAKNERYWLKKATQKLAAQEEQADGK